MLTCRAGRITSKVCRELGQSILLCLGERGQRLYRRRQRFHLRRPLQQRGQRIEHGVVFSPMHAWRGQLTDGEMQDDVAYIRWLSEQAR